MRDCLCKLTAEERLRREKAEDEIRRAEIRRKRLEADERLRQVELAKHQATADDCWTRRGYHCSLPKEELFVFCKACTRFNPSRSAVTPAPPPIESEDEFDEHGFEIEEF